MSHNNKPVYVTGIGRVSYCRHCGEPAQQCQCQVRRRAEARPGFPNDGWVRVSRESKGRGGKVVSLISGLPQDAALLADVAQTLKRACASGGTVQQGVIVIQGDHRDRIVAQLSAMGYRVKRAGG